jgi:hypothetical protein
MIMKSESGDLISDLTALTAIKNKARDVFFHSEGAFNIISDLIKDKLDYPIQAYYISTRLSQLLLEVNITRELIKQLTELIVTTTLSEEEEGVKEND